MTTNSEIPLFRVLVATMQQIHYLLIAQTVRSNNKMKER